MKRVYFLLILSLVFDTIYAQQTPEIIDPIKDQKVISGYTVRPIRTIDGAYGYDILQDNKPVVHQFQNPLPYAPKGIQKKEDVFKIAEWLIKEYQLHGQWRNSVPPHIAHELKIETH